MLPRDREHHRSRDDDAGPGEWTIDDLDALPDDGLRYELVDGVLLVSPSPLLPHQVGLAALLVRLTSAAPADLRVLPAPLDVPFSRTRQLQPDIVVLHRSEPMDRKVTGLPVLVVEVLSAERPFPVTIVPGQLLR